ncbi:MAG: hypothetical protein H0T78_07520 [Longispora sp.]|nr:hypothetical protein [Longispora sp. (in: high G+C Gram-positive bacteria)]
MSDPSKNEQPDLRMNRLQRRRAKIAAEIGRNRRGDYSVPTWVLVAILVAFLLGWAALVFLI